MFKPHYYLVTMISRKLCKLAEKRYLFPTREQTSFWGSWERVISDCHFSRKGTWCGL